MKKSFSVLVLSAFLAVGCAPRSEPVPQNAPNQEKSSDAEPKNAPNQEKSSDFALPDFFSNASASPLDDLRRRQAKAERRAANGDVAGAAREADYVASQIRTQGLDRRGTDGAGQDAREFATLLESALATLEDCAEQARTTEARVLDSEPTSVQF